MYYWSNSGVQLDQKSGPDRFYVIISYIKQQNFRRKFNWTSNSALNRLNHALTITGPDMVRYLGKKVNRTMLYT